MAIAKKWLPTAAPDIDLVLHLKEEIGISSELATLMAQRGITNYKNAEAYFNPNADQLHDPFTMKDMDVAVERIRQAIEHEEPILFYGDYDVDGTTSVSLMMLYFKAFYNNIHFYVPDRQKEGYGISLTGIDFAKDNGFSLVVALDCGIKANHAIDYANDKGVDFIICDHHTPGEELPKAVAVLDPKRADCQYPYKELSGCGVGFKLISAFHKKWQPEAPNPLEFVDLLAVSIASDIVPLTGENRVLSYLGLQKLNDNPLEGLATMIRLIGFKGKYNVTDVVFKIGPRINAAGRLKHAQFAVELLIGKEKGSLDDLAQEIDTLNKERRTIERGITAECLEILEGYNPSAKSTVVYGEHWHKGVIGIVASKLVEQYYRPTVVFTKSEEGLATGSARSVEGYNLYAAVNACAHLLEQFGGHKAAAGMKIKIENIPAFRDAFEKAVSDTITADELIPKAHYDLELNASRVGWKFYNSISRLGPFGPENHRPRLVSRKVRPTNVKVVGADHLKFALVEDQRYVDCIAFGQAHYIDMLREEELVDICYSLDVNEWQGNSFLQLDIKDIKPTELHEA